MTPEQRRELIDDITQNIQQDVRAGFTPPDEIVSPMLEAMASDSEEYDIEELRPEAERILRDAVAKQLREQAKWPKVTDCDRFDAAFSQLELDGVVCRQDFSCCGTCAAAEIWDEIEAEQDEGREVIGCAHYNWQDTESAVDGYGIYLSYGSVLESEQAAVDIGHKIADAMRSQGLKVTWDGTLSKRLHVALDWKRRMPV